MPITNTFQPFPTPAVGTATATTLAYTPGVVVPVGALMCLFLTKTGTGIPSAFTDNATGGGAANVWAPVTGGVSTTTKYAGWYWCVLTRPFAVTTTATATFATSTNRALSGGWCANPASSTPFDVASVGANTGTALSCASVTPTTADSLVLNGEVDAGTTGATPAAGYTEAADVVVTAATLHYQTQYKIETAAAAVTGGGTLATSKAWQQVQAVFKLAPAVTPLFPTTGLLDTFVGTAGSNVSSRAGWNAGTQHFVSGDVSWLVAPSGTATPNTSPGSNFWGTVPGADCEVYAKYIGSIDSLILTARIGFTSNIASSGYLLRVGFSGTVTIETSGTTVLATLTGTAPVAGDQFGLQIVGTKIIAWRNIVAGGLGWQPFLWLDDATTSVAGAIGMADGTGNTPSISDFYGGTYSPTTPATLTFATAASVATVACSITAPSILNGTSTCQSTAALTATAQTVLALGNAASSSTAALSVAIVPQVVGTAASVSTASLAAQAVALLALAAAASQSTATAAVQAPQALTLSASASVSTVTLSVRAALLLTLGGSASTSTSTAQPNAPPQIQGTAASVSTATASVGVRAIVSGTAASVSTASVSVLAAPQVVGSAASISTSTLAVSIPALIQPSTSASSSSAALSLTAPPVLALATSASTSTASGSITAPRLLTLATAASTSATSIILTASPIISAASASASSTSAAVTAQTLISLSTAASVSSASANVATAGVFVSGTSASVSTTSATVIAHPSISGTSASTSTAALAVTAAPQISGSSASVSTASANVTATGAANITGSAASISTASLLASAPTRLALGAAASSSTATAQVTAPSRISGTSTSTTTATLAVQTTPNIAGTSTSSTTAALALRTGAALRLQPAASDSTIAVTIGVPPVLVLGIAASTSTALLDITVGGGGGGPYDPGSSTGQVYDPGQADPNSGTYDPSAIGATHITGTHSGTTYDPGSPT